MEPVIGLDFGTTNSAITVAGADRHATLAAFADGPAKTTSFRSILYFPAKERYSQRTFGASKLRSGEELTTVAKGLALRALES